MEIRPTVALLQEAGSMPAEVTDAYHVLGRRAATKAGGPQRFNTAVLVRKDAGTIGSQVPLKSDLEWVHDELSRFEGNLVGGGLSLETGERFHAVSVYSPAWPLDPTRFPEADVSPIKLKNNPDLWVTDLLWAGLKGIATLDAPLIVGGDFNASVTFDALRKGGRGNDETMQRMADLGLVECLVKARGHLTPTFKNPHGGKVIHQMDHLFVSRDVAGRLVDCVTGDRSRVFDAYLSDHLPIIATFGPQAVAKHPV